MKAWLALALAGGCTVARDVLVDMVTTCPAALAGEPGQACAFDGVCTEPASSAGSASCCSDTAYCANSRLVVSHECNPDCAPCDDDRQCKRGAAICEDHVCVPCEPPVCPELCPPNWVHLQRNGCETCDCAPPTTCDAAATAQCSLGICYPGADCAAGCAPNDIGCCSDQCSSVGCPLPVPAGCLVPCPPTMTSCGVCATDKCNCAGGAWQCTVVCAPGLHSSCVGPPS